VVADVSARSLTGFVRTDVAAGAIVVSDGWGGYDPLSKQGYRHRPHTLYSRFPSFRASQISRRSSSLTI